MTPTVSKGKVITLECTLKSEDNRVVYTSNVGTDPLIYMQGANQVIPGIESAVEGMTVGQTKQVVVEPERGFGERDPGAVQEVPKASVPDGIKVGTQLHGKDQAGRDVRPIIAEIKDQTVLLDFNHPLAGKTVLFDLKVVGIA